MRNGDAVDVSHAAFEALSRLHTFSVDAAARLFGRPELLQARTFAFLCGGAGPRVGRVPESVPESDSSEEESSSEEEESAFFFGGSAAEKAAAAAAEKAAGAAAEKAAADAAEKVAAAAAVDHMRVSSG